MRGCRKVRGAIAASLYEPLHEDEQALLERHLGACPACRAEAEAMRAMVSAIPRRAEALEADLLPALRQQLADASAWRWSVPVGFARALAPVAACLLLVSLAAYVLGPGRFEDREAVVVVATPLEEALVEARHLARNDFMGALSVLHEALAQHAEDPRAGEAQLLLAQLEFAHGQRYAEAYAAYETLRNRYWDTWEQSPDSVERFNLLDETRAQNFEGLYALDAARHSSADALAQLEMLVASNPETLLGARAVAAMCEVVCGEITGDWVLKAAALEEVRAVCSNPTAVAQLNLTLGNTYWRELKDAARARPFYSEVADSAHPLLASVAQQRLVELDAATGP